MADTITIRTDDETEHALDVLTTGGISRSAAIRQAVLETAGRRQVAVSSPPEGTAPAGILPGATAVTRDVLLAPADNVRLVELCGPLDEHLRLIESRLGVEVRLGTKVEDLDARRAGGNGAAAGERPDQHPAEREAAGGDRSGGASSGALDVRVSVAQVAHGGRPDYAAYCGGVRIGIHSRREADGLAGVCRL